MRQEKLVDLVERYFPACTHPDCGGRGGCATDMFHQRAKKLAFAARISGRLELLRERRAVKRRKARR